MGLLGLPPTCACTEHAEAAAATDRAQGIRISARRTLNEVLLCRLQGDRTRGISDLTSLFLALLHDDTPGVCRYARLFQIDHKGKERTP
jgi:hypothetical protein